jgi:hypothetical protein
MQPLSSLLQLFHNSTNSTQAQNHNTAVSAQPTQTLHFRKDGIMKFRIASIAHLTTAHKWHLGAHEPVQELCAGCSPQSSRTAALHMLGADPGAEIAGVRQPQGLPS